MGVPGPLYAALRSYAGFKRVYAKGLGMQENGTRYHEVKDDDKTKGIGGLTAATTGLGGGMGDDAKKRALELDDEDGVMRKRAHLG